MERAILEMGDPVEVGVELDLDSSTEDVMGNFAVGRYSGRNRCFFYSLPCGEAAMQRRSQIGSSCFISQVFC